MRAQRRPRVDTGPVGNRFLTVAEVAEVLRVLQKTVRRWIDEGLLPSERLGWRILIPASALDDIEARAWAATGRPAPAQPERPSVDALLDRALANATSSDIIDLMERAIR